MIKTSYNDIYDALKKIINTLADNYEFIELKDNPLGSNYLQSRTFTTSISSASANTTYDLPAPLITSVEVKDANGNIIDPSKYTFDGLRGKITPNEDLGNITVEATFEAKAPVFRFKPAVCDCAFDIAFVVGITQTENEALIGATIKDSDGNLITSIGYTSIGILGASFWSQGGNLFIFTNSNRIIVIIESEGTYAMLYAGAFIPLSTHPAPLFISGTHSWNRSSFEAHDYTSEYIRNFRYSRFFAFTYDLQLKYGDYSCGQLPNHPRECDDSMTIRYPDDVDIVVFPLVRGTCYLFGQLDGVYWAPATNLTSETTLSVNGKDAIVFPDVYRTLWCSWIAITD